MLHVLTVLGTEPALTDVNWGPSLFCPDLHTWVAPNLGRWTPTQGAFLLSWVAQVPATPGHLARHPDSESPLPPRHTPSSILAGHGTAGRTGR